MVLKMSNIIKFGTPLKISNELEEMRQNIVLKTVGFSKLGVTKPISVLGENQKADLNICLKMASGFGGSNAAMLVQKLEL